MGLVLLDGGQVEDRPMDLVLLDGGQVGVLGCRYNDGSCWLTNKRVY